ncbi:3292_t:CDS:2 [Ambispora gerdemannii]|uniref:3292_t:CDS:1 n=1 Tax=Ambispora gerdemannii TaxID=144530 RepID=A0A9N9AAE4_9GLOM|nr:3292_t:CDS:2 [Ambispora gerdemannii]
MQKSTARIFGSELGTTSYRLGVASIDKSKDKRMLKYLVQMAAKLTERLNMMDE